MAANPYNGHGNPYGHADSYGNVPTPMELSQDKLDEKARKWQQLQARVRFYDLYLAYLAHLYLLLLHEYKTRIL
jgi:hypothetical protein